MKCQNMTIETVCENIFKIEKKLHLFEKQIQGVYFWKIIRFELSEAILKHLGLALSARNKEFNSAIDKIKAFYPKVKNTYLHSVYSRSSKIDTLVLEHGRKVLIKDKYIDVYTKYIVEVLQRKNINYEIVDNPYLGQHYHLPSPERSYFENATIGFLIKKFLLKIKLTNEEKKLIQNIIDTIKNTFNVHIDIEQMIKQRLNTFKARKMQYKRMLKKRAVKKVYLVVSYVHGALIAACQELNVECIELQHGVMNRYHLGYSFPHNKKVPYFPDKLELFGKYWQDITPLPLENVTMKVLGYPYLNDTLKVFNDLEKKEKQIVFLSCGVELATLAYNFAKQNNSYTIIHKLHPVEFEVWKQAYPVLLEAIKLPNFQIVENEKHLYSILKVSSYAIGVNSTAIYESLLLDCKVILVELPGMREYMQKLLDLNIAKSACTVIDIEKAIKQDNFATVNHNYFFKEKVDFN